MALQSNLGSRTPRIMNSSVYEQIFRTRSVSDDVLCLELGTRKPSTSWSDKLAVSAPAVFVGEMQTKTNQYVFFWVIPQRLSSKSRRFGTLYWLHLHGQVDEEWLGWDVRCIYT